LLNFILKTNIVELFLSKIIRNDTMRCHNDVVTSLHLLTFVIVTSQHDIKKTIIMVFHSVEKMQLNSK